MTSLEIISAKKTIQDYMNSLNFPKELERMILKDIYEEAKEDALREALAEAQQKEAENGKQ